MSSTYNVIWWEFIISIDNNTFELWYDNTFI